MIVKRRQHYQTGGADQNEKVGMFGFKILCVIDGFSRYPIHWEVTEHPPDIYRRSSDFTSFFAVQTGRDKSPGKDAQ